MMGDFKTQLLDKHSSKPNSHDYKLRKLTFDYRPGFSVVECLKIIVHRGILNAV